MAEFRLIENDLRLLAVVDTTEKHGLVITAAYPEDQVGLTPEQAHLIAAAPEMYEALKGFMAVCQKYSDMLIQMRDHKKTAYWVVDQMDGLLDEYGAIADKALTKAEGK